MHEIFADVVLSLYQHFERLPYRLFDATDSAALARLLDYDDLRPAGHRQAGKMVFVASTRLQRAFL